MSDNLKLYGRNYPYTTGFKAKDENGNILTYTRGGASFTGTVYQDNEGYVVLDDDPGANASITHLTIKEDGVYNAPSGVAYNQITVGTDSGNDVNFYDYDGTIVYSYTAQEFLALTVMPANPTHTGLTSQGWNWSLITAQDYVSDYGMLEIGQMYITDDGKTRFYITIDNDENTLEEDIPFKIVFATSVVGGVTIDWGDNSESTVTTGTANTRTIYSHTYATNGDYTVTLNCTSGTYKLTSGCIFGNVYSDRAVNAKRFKKIEIGKNTNFGTDNWDNFTHLSNLETITLPSGCASWISRGSFGYCFSLKHITIPTGVTYVGDGSGGGDPIFGYNRNLKSVSFPSGVTNLATNGFQYCYNLKRVSLPFGIASISKQYFQGCTNLSKISIPTSVTSIGDGAFQYCYALEEINLFSALTSIGTSAFGSCRGLKKINTTNTIPADVTIGNSAFAGCFGLRTITIEDGITSIGESVFDSCRSLIEVNLPTTLTSLKTKTFINCHRLQKVTGLSNVTSIATQCFYYCYGLPSISLPSGLTAITDSVLRECRTLKLLTIPATITSIAANAFNTCASLQEMHFLSTTPPTLAATSAFTSTNSCAIYVPYSEDHSVLAAYQAATNWSTLASRIQEEPQEEGGE